MVHPFFHCTLHHLHLSRPADKGIQTKIKNTSFKLDVLHKKIHYTMVQVVCIT